MITPLIDARKSFVVLIVAARQSGATRRQAQLVESRLSLAASTVVLVFIPRLSSGWRRSGLQRVERGKAHDDVGQPEGIPREPFPQGGHVGQSTRLKRGGQLIGQFALAAALVRRGESSTMVRQACCSGRRSMSMSKVRRYASRGKSWSR